MAVEAKRGCGYRKVGGIYLVCEGEGRACGRFPLALKVCPACGGGVKQSRGWTWINPAKLFADQICSSGRRLDANVDRVLDCPSCPMHDLEAIQEAGLLWIGASFYKTPHHFQLEAAAQGICRRITAVPRNFKLGETWVFLAHPNVIPGENEEGMQVMVPGVFNAFLPNAIEQIVTETQAEDEEAMAALTKRGITPVAVPDDDPDHQGTVYDKVTELDK